MREAGLERFPTRVPGLDTILGGGLLQGSVYILQGDPGAGKTVLANQIAFEHARAGGKALYVTMLAELHGRLLCYLRGFDFHDADLVPGGVYYVSAFGVLEQDGLKGFLDLLRAEVKAHQVSLLVVDGVTALREAAPQGREVRRLIHELQAHSSLTACTTLCLSSGFLDAPAEQTVADGLIDLHDRPQGERDVRFLHVRKLRGSDYLRGRHAFRITEAGIVLFPRLEALLGVPVTPAVPCEPGRLSTGAPALDRLVGGGYPCGSTTILLGPPGTGKTTLALQFLRGATRDDPALVFSFHERPERIVAKSPLLGFDIGAAVEAGALTLLWTPPTEVLLDELGHQLLDGLDRTGARRLVIDGLDGFRLAAGEDRLPTFFTALGNELRARGVTTIYTAELPQVVDPEVRAPVPNVSAAFENLLVLRQVELDWRLRRVLTIAKMRDSEYAGGAREFCIMPGEGFHVDERPFDPAHPMADRAKAAARSRAPTRKPPPRRGRRRTP